MKPTFEKTVAVLVKAYFDGTLEHMSCRRCAVGNLMTSAGVEFGERSSDWLAYIAVTFRDKEMFDFNETLALQQINATGYSPSEINRIEATFEHYAWDENADFNGLMAVVDVLADIHGIDLEKKEAAKLLFAKP